MRLRTLILVLVAAGCGLVAAVLVSQYVGGGNQVVAAPTAEKVKVLYAKTTVPGQVAIDKPEDFFEVREVSRDEVRDGIGEYEKVKGRVLRLPLGKGKPLAEMDLYGPNESIGITHKLKPGERPITVKVTPLTNTAGFVRPGDRVDVVATARVHGPNVTAKTILQDIEVLAIDQSLQNSTNEVARQADLVTLRATDMEQVLTLAAFSEGHTLRLVPRRADDTKMQADKSVTATFEKKNFQEERKPPKEEEDEPRPTPVVATKPDVKPAEATPRGPAAPGVHELTISTGQNQSVTKFKIQDKKDEDGKK